jgi:hypothetical protein
MRRRMQRKKEELLNKRGKGYDDIG